jgi:tetratricopeptide (TPR) repeat protein
MSPSKIILILMIKNESKIIERCIANALEHVDAISILDTGSTDNTIEVCTNVLSLCGKPFVINVELFKNFGYNRSISFLKAQELCKKLEWEADSTYCLTVDADMVIKPSPAFKSFSMTMDGYMVNQVNGSLKYYNMRFLKCSYPWKCLGRTHECWDDDKNFSKIPYEIFYIDDKNDGGCKADKYERDIRLLTEDIQENPQNARSYFYLGQSFNCISKFDEAIEMYKKRIALEGWREEVWYSHYQISKCYEQLGDIELMECWSIKAFKYYPNRSEPLYYLTKYFRETNQHHKAYHYYLKGKNIPYPKDDLLFIEDNVYKGLFQYENTILVCYVNIATKQDSLLDVVTYINKNYNHYVNNVWDNSKFYLEPLIGNTYKAQYSRFMFKDCAEYNASSPCIIPYSDEDPDKRFLLNIRYINYLIIDGKYTIKSADQNIKTINGYVFLNAAYQPTNDIVFINDEYRKYPSEIQGLEDIRLFVHQNKIKFTASSKNIVNDGRIVIACGDYNLDTNKLDNVCVLDTPDKLSCEKNWVYVSPSSLEKTKGGRMSFVYDWYPLKIGTVNDNNVLDIHTTYETPSFFSRFRGSSPIVEYNKKLWCVVHMVCSIRNTRGYSHAVVQLNLDTAKPEQFTLPFYFRQHKIEYCMGFYIKNNNACFIFSENDNTPGKVELPLTNLKFLKV